MLKKKLLSVFLIFISLACIFFPVKQVNAMPFYQLEPHELVLRASFSTSFSSSSKERKHNIKLASKTLNNSFVDANAEFSFNHKIGIRNSKNGYKTAKIISDGKFVDGIGGGVCQVSTTLYNALLLSGMNVIEYHPHSLSVSYVAPSCDAMVSYGYADLKFINNTLNPIIIRCSTDNDILKIDVYGQPMKEKYYLESVIKGYIEPNEEVLVPDLENRFPNLKIGEKQYLIYPKKGIVSQAYLIKKSDGKVVKTLLRKDKYRAINGVYIEGKLPANENGNAESE